MFPDCNSSSVVIDFRDHVFINNEKVGAGFACKTNGFSMISEKWMFRNIWKSIQFGNPGRPKRHKYHNSWKRNTLQLLMFWGLNDACGRKCCHQFARWCFHNNEKPGGGFAYKSNAFSMISKIHSLETYEHRRHLELSIDQKGLWLLLFFFILHVPKVTPKDVQSTQVSIFH
jgi:hypothetical protein